MKKQLTCLVLVTLMFTAAGVLSAQSEMSAALIGAEEVPAVVTAAFGSASFNVNFSESTLGMNYELSATNLKDAFMAHVHCAPAGTNGPIVLWLAGRPSSPATAAYDIDGPLGGFGQGRRQRCGRPYCVCGPGGECDHGQQPHRLDWRDGHR